MIRDGLDLLTGAEMYRRYNMWNNTNENRKGNEYLFDSEDRLNNVVDYYNNKNLYINNIGELSDVFTYKFKITNRIEESNKLIFGVLDFGYENGLRAIEDLACKLCEMALEVDSVFHNCNYKILDESDNTYIVLNVE